MSRLRPARLDHEDLEWRLKRAIQEVLPRYAIEERIDPSRPGRSWTVRGGKRDYVVTIEPGRRTSQGIWSRRCTCADFTGHRDLPDKHCKHLFAVILKHPELHYLLLDFFV